ncbi:hypothetical protein PMKS-002246 [Pichia membranifaciens]|uniref:Uncharacterized protein n=1 Tax=Pichia membranifaciens TaxID=4926 RepID=A0A1Q2YH12_9ASCO|nr:hypothetical protein PMKS-002246 [Pichia membranifaciens]
MNTIQEEDKEALAAAAAAGAGIGAGAAGTTTGASSNITSSAPRGGASSATFDSNTANSANAGANAPPAVEKPFARVAPPTAATKASSNETNVYLVAVLLIILAFLFSRFF